MEDTLQFGTASTSDFEEGTVTFDMEGDFWIRAGEYAIIKIETLDQKIKIEEFVKTL